MSILVQTRDFSGIPGLGVQRQIVRDIATGKARPRRVPPTTPKPPSVASAGSESDLWDAIESTILSVDDEGAAMVAEFDSEEEAIAVGLRMDATAKGKLGVGIRGKFVDFWRRGV